MALPAAVALLAGLGALEALTRTSSGARVDVRRFGFLDGRTISPDAGKLAACSSLAEAIGSSRAVTSGGQRTCAPAGAVDWDAKCKEQFGDDPRCEGASEAMSFGSKVVLKVGQFFSGMFGGGGISTLEFAAYCRKEPGAAYSLARFGDALRGKLCGEAFPDGVPPAPEGLEHS